MNLDSRQLQTELNATEPDGRVIYIPGDGFYAIVPNASGQDGQYYRGTANLMYLGVTYVAAVNELREQFGEPARS